jgi:hypothetical protein
VHDLFPNPQETRIYKTSSSPHIVLKEEVEPVANPPRREGFPVGYSGFKPRAGLDPLGKSYTNAVASGHSDVQKPNERVTFLKTSLKSDATLQQLESTRLTEVSANEKAYREPIAGYSGYRPRLVRNYDQK